MIEIHVYSYYFAGGTGALKGLENNYNRKIVTFAGPFDKFSVKDKILIKGTARFILKDNETSPFLKARTERILSELSKNK